MIAFHYTQYTEQAVKLDVNLVVIDGLCLPIYYPLYMFGIWNSLNIHSKRT